MNPTCNHKPDGSIAPFWFTCKQCHQPIESDDCDACDGSGMAPRRIGSHLACRSCGGTGVGKWRLIDDGGAANT